MAKSGEFYSFDEVLRRLSIDENRLKRLVSEGEIRAFREGDQMKFKKGEIDNLAGKGGRGGTSDTSLSEISLEDDVPSKSGKKGAGETLTDDLLEEPDLTKRGGMKTAEISSQDTFIDKGGDQVGMSTEPIDFTEEVAGEEPEQIGAEAAATKRAKAGTATAVRKPPLVTAEARTHPLLVVALVLGSLASIWALMVVISISKKQPQEGISETAMKAFFSPPDGR
jgi:hypothetical protein